MQLAALVRPVALLNLPPGHSRNTRREVAPASGQYPPTGQLSHTDCPRSLAKLPMAQGVQSAAPDKGLCVPSEHGKHLVLPLPGA